MGRILGTGLEIVENGHLEGEGQNGHPLWEHSRDCDMEKLGVGIDRTTVTDKIEDGKDWHTGQGMVDIGHQEGVRKVERTRRAQ